MRELERDTKILRASSKQQQSKRERERDRELRKLDRAREDTDSEQQSKKKHETEDFRCRHGEIAKDVKRRGEGQCRSGFSPFA